MGQHVSKKDLSRTLNFALDGRDQEKKSARKNKNLSQTSNIAISSKTVNEDYKFTDTDGDKLPENWQRRWTNNPKRLANGEFTNWYYKDYENQRTVWELPPEVKAQCKK